MPEIDFEKETLRLVEIKEKHRFDTDPFLDELKLLKKWPQDQLSELLLQLCWHGGSLWPSVLCFMGADPNYVDDEGQTALSICVHAACDGEEEPVDTFETACELLELDASPNSRYLGCSVTTLALHWELQQFVALFLLAGADLDLEEPDSLSDETLREVLISSKYGWAKRLVDITERARMSGKA